MVLELRLTVHVCICTCVCVHTHVCACQEKHAYLFALRLLSEALNIRHLFIHSFGQAARVHFEPNFLVPGSNMNTIQTEVLT